MKTYGEIGQDIGDLVTQKQAAYGDSFGKSGQVMRILYPDGIPTDKLDDALTVVRVLDKLFRIATDRDALGESPWKDIAGYALLSIRRLEWNKEGYIGPGKNPNKEVVLNARMERMREHLYKRHVEIGKNSTFCYECQSREDHKDGDPPQWQKNHKHDKDCILFVE